MLRFLRDAAELSIFLAVGESAGAALLFFTAIASFPLIRFEFKELNADGGFFLFKGVLSVRVVGLSVVTGPPAMVCVLVNTLFTFFTSTTSTSSECSDCLFSFFFFEGEGEK